MPNQHASSHFVSGGVPYASTASGAAAATYGMLGGSMPLLGAGSAQPSGEGCPGVSLMLTADQAAALLDQGSQPIVETERVCLRFNDDGMSSRYIGMPLSCALHTMPCR